MQKRLLGKIGQESTILSFGGAALHSGTEEMAKEAIGLALNHGINHFDIAPSYGRAEELVGPFIPDIRDRVFLACKTLKRDRKGAEEELRRSLKVLRTDHFDLYQIHGVNKMEDVNQVVAKGGAVEAFIEAKDEGIVNHLGITGHNMIALAEALRKFDFETVMFPLNFVLHAHPDPENDYRPILALCEQKGVGAIAIKAVAKRRWEKEEHTYRTWYEPLDQQREIDLALWFTLSHPITTAVLPSELKLWPKVIDAAERFRNPTQPEMQELTETAKPLRPLFPQ
jgi:aryl-alcohol dehydrogenase-like predicted oxidoreductase